MVGPGQVKGKLNASSGQVSGQFGMRSSRLVTGNLEQMEFSEHVSHFFICLAEGAHGVQERMEGLTILG